MYHMMRFCSIIHGRREGCLSNTDEKSVMIEEVMNEEGGSVRILLAEDEKRMAKALIALLKQEKYDVDHMSDGTSALDALDSGVYDIAVIDVMMPEMNGFEVASHARKSGIKTPILMLTAKSQLDDKVEG